MDSVQQLEFRLKLSKLKLHSDFDKAFSDSNFARDFAAFTKTKIGFIWLRSEKSALFREWQESS